MVKPGEQRGAGILLGVEGLGVGRAAERVDRVVAIGARAQVGVAVDQAGEHGGFGEVDDLGACGNLRGVRGLHRLDALALDDDDHVLADVVAGGVEEAAGANVSDDGLRRLRLMLTGLALALFGGLLLRQARNSVVRNRWRRAASSAARRDRSFKDDAPERRCYTFPIVTLSGDSPRGNVVKEL